ncbi:MAG: CxxxxCH/CxxCH domain-containing protein [Deltaproteobacteria bacterium]|nr:CxxxxCH/CxxCH domain-containing protein [Deltaproteobacteria bacterium]
MIRDAAIHLPAGRALLSAAILVLTCHAPSARAQAACDPATSALGAHLSHSRDSFARTALACTECHAPVCATNQAETLLFGALARKDGAQPAWDPASRTCSGVYCHGATLAGGPTGPVAWAYVDPSLPRPLSQQCTLCHGFPPSAPHEAVQPTACRGCHASAAADGSVDVAGGLHVDGKLDVSGGACGSCHGNPPATGAHVAHYGLEGGSGSSDLSILQDRYPDASPTTAPAVYAFGCGSCHPVTPSTPSTHRNGTVDVVLWEGAAPAATLKGRALASASYDPATGTCSGVYCHSSGQEAPAYRSTPGWFSGAHLGCASCHDNPPAYASGGAGSATANSHLGLADDGYEFGHFLGMPGAWHSSKHGGAWGAGQDAAPITCQTCHYATTDPANTGPSGFYYLDTTGNYALEGGDPGRISWGWQASIQCASCHGAGGAATGTGKVLPLRHVNGTRDVTFDPRTTLPPIPWLPAAPNTPVRPYWVTDPGLAGYWPSGLTWTGTTLSFGLDTSAYDPATKTCTSVACHVAEQRPVWGRPYQYYTNASATCYTCHPM